MNDSTGDSYNLLVCRSISSRLAGLVLLSLGLPAFVQAASISQLTTAETWRRLELRLSGIPSVANPYDPNLLRLDAVFQMPSGKSLRVPAFWFQDYQRALASNKESLTASGSPEWRVRFTPTETGTHSITLLLSTNGSPEAQFVVTNFTVAAGSTPPRTGYVRLAPARQYFETTEGKPIKLSGHNVCWHGDRGTFDYDAWFPSQQGAGENFARLWMCPWAFGLEADANTLNRYRQDRAWQLDYVFRLAEQRGIYLLLCLDYHGMYESSPDYWGGNNFWPKNPYNVLNGGPSQNANGFFTNSTAQAAYKKRLRYMVGRYGYSPNLLAWEFFNEIDNVYSQLVAKDVAAWHQVMGEWLRAQDPFHHLVTTSLTGSSDRSEIWNIPALDFAAYHSYGEASPASRLAGVAQSFLSRYKKPVMIGEFGVDFRGWNRPSDPFLRGFRQALWGGALGGSVGTSMSWWWENIHSENVYPVFKAMTNILDRTAWCKGAWTNIGFKTSGAPPALVGDPIPGATPFDLHLPLGGVWAAKPSGALAVPNSYAAGSSATELNSFVHGSAHSDLRIPFKLNAWFTNNARLVLHLNSVSGGAILVVRSDGAELLRTNLANLDNAWTVNNEYNLDIPVNLPAGKHLIEVANAGVDWFFLDWVRLERVRPASYTGNWQPSPEAIGLRGASEALAYAVAPGLSYPGGATNNPLPTVTGQSLVLTNWPAGRFFVDWYFPATGTKAARTESTTTNGMLTLSLPDFTEDLAGIIYPPSKMAVLGVTPRGDFQFQLESETGGRYTIEKSTDLSSWGSMSEIVNTEGRIVLSDRVAESNAFFRTRAAPFK